MKGRVLVIAGSDSGGGAGIQADIKAVTALDGFAMTAITALTAQNTRGVHGVVAVEPDFVREQIRVVAEDLGADCIKTGMLGTVPVIEAVADALETFCPGVPRVIDPVMVAKGGHRLLDADAVQAMTDRLVRGATLVTPNLPEAEVLAGFPIADAADRDRALEALRLMGPDGVLLKGGHGEGDTVVDLLAEGAEAVHRFESPRLDSRNTHGTGCTLASACAAGIAQGLTLGEAVTRARAYVHRAIETAPGFGGGHGPLNHAWVVE